MSSADELATAFTEGQRWAAAATGKPPAPTTPALQVDVDIAAIVALAKAAWLTPTQVALAFCLRCPEVSSVLVGARHEAQLEGNLAAVGVALSAGLLADLDKVFPA